MCWGGAKCSAIRPGVAWGRGKMHREGRIDSSFLEATRITKTLNPQIIEEGKGHFRMKITTA